MATNEADYPFALISKFTNKIIKRYNIKWVNEDLGLWQIKGKVLPYPLPPVFNQTCLEHCIRNINFYKKSLDTELYVEFPGLSEGHSFCLGDKDAFEFFNEAILKTDAICVLDTGHLLSYQWQKGKSKNYLDGLLDHLPLPNCHEIHLSGCSIIKDEFFDFHHGVILDQQLKILEYLIPHCHNLKTITYEDPKFLDDGTLIEKAWPNFNKLKEIVGNWKEND